jgi:hypothetical protein
LRLRLRLRGGDSLRAKQREHARHRHRELPDGHRHFSSEKLARGLVERPEQPMCRGRQLERWASGINVLEISEKRASDTRPRFTNVYVSIFETSNMFANPIVAFAI